MLDAMPAARNNAEWCDLVCRTHGIETAFTDHVWSALSRSPAFYPDAVTLSPLASARDVLSRIDTSPGCSVKDSFATLDLTKHGFHVLFEAEWIHRPAAAPGRAPMWTLLRKAADLQAWNLGDVLQPSLLDNTDVAVMASYRGDTVVSGAIANRTGRIVGLSNVVTTTGDRDRAWAGAVNAVAVHFPGLQIVGYEHGADLVAAHRAGFAGTGPLRVWLKD